MRTASILFLLFGLALSGCAGVPPSLYDCSERLDTPELIYTATGRDISWRTPRMNDLIVFLMVFDDRKFSAAGFAAHGFADPSLAGSTVVVQVDNNKIADQTYSAPGAPWQPRYAVEFSLGTETRRAWVQNGFATFTLPDFQALMTHPGDLRVTLYDREGGLLRSRSLPTGPLREVEARLQTMQAKSLSNARDPARLCKFDNSAAYE